MHRFVKRALPIALLCCGVVIAGGGVATPATVSIESASAQDINCYNLGPTQVDDEGDCVTFTSNYGCGCRVQLGVIYDCLEYHFCVSTFCRGRIGITIDTFCA